MERFPKERLSVTSILVRCPRPSTTSSWSRIKRATAGARLRLRCVRCADTFAGDGEQRITRAVRGDNSTAWNTVDAISGDGQRCTSDFDSVGANEELRPGMAAATAGARARF